MSNINSATNNSSNSDWVCLNVGGKTFQTTKDTLSRYPNSFLSRLVNGDLPSDKDASGAYLIDGSPTHFDTILTYLRRGVLNLDGNEKAAKDLLCEAAFYNIQPLVDEIRNTMRPVTNRVEYITLFVEYRKKQRVGTMIVCSKTHDDYEVLQALRRKFNCKGYHGRYNLWYTEQLQLSSRQNEVELVLRGFGFAQESYNDKYDENVYDNGYQVKCWKFTRAVSK